MSTTVLSNKVMTEKEAVNAMLAAVDIAPVGSLTGTTDLEVTNAIDRLSKINRTIQTIGWDFNTKKEVKYLRNVDGEVVIGSNVLRVTPVANSRWKNLVWREGKIFDRGINSFTLDADVYLDIVELVNFEDLPQTARDYITARAVRVHERFEAADDIKHDMASEEEIMAWSNLINDHSTAGNETMMDNVEVYSSIFGRE